MLNTTTAALVEYKVRQMYRDEQKSLAAAKSNNPVEKRGQVIITTTQATLEKYANYAGAAYVVNSKAWDCPISCQTAATAGTVVYHQWADVVGANVGYVAYKESTKEIIISFRGSQTLFDWITNADFGQDAWPSSVSGSKVHSGFLDAHKAQASTIQAKIAELVAKYPTFNIVFTGHSLGGALASIGAADLARLQPTWASRIVLYTYGQPRTGNSAYASWVQNLGFPIFRVTYQEDMVARVPPTSFGYSHHSQESWYPTGGGLKFCGANGESSTCINSISVFSLSTADHSDYPGLAH
ncbi:hypothetical protein EC988_004558 [Linderina pennispora]|nr:hypothetical protein EC988_004558 [Linderina pennispora]